MADLYAKRVRLESADGFTRDGSTVGEREDQLNQWADRHDAAVHDVLVRTAPGPGGSTASDGDRAHKFAAEQAILLQLRAWALYAGAHLSRYESKIGDDGVLGREWQKIGEALRGLLNGELGRLDGGTLDAFILNTMGEHGIDTEGL